MTDTKFTLWSPAGAPVAVEYSVAAIDEIRQSVTEGFQKFSRGGIEAGGVLYGTHEGGITRVMATREITCEHGMGPSFQLSANDKNLLREQLELYRTDARLDGMVPVGWYVAHTRGEINLTAADLELYAEFFPEAGQVALVVRPGRGATTRAGFFVREADGTVHADKSYEDFNLPDRLSGAIDRPSRDRTAVQDRRPLPYENLPLPRTMRGPAAPPHDEFVPTHDTRHDERTDERRDEFVQRHDERDVERRDERLDERHDERRDEFVPRHDQPVPEPEPLAPPRYEAEAFNRPETPTFGQYDTSAPQYDPYPEQRRSWSWVWLALLVLFAAGAAVFAIRYFGPQLKQEPIALSVLDKGGQLQIAWSHASPNVLESTGGALEIVDGKDSKRIALSPADLARGTFTYARKSADVQIQLDVRGPDGAMSHAASRFLGTEPTHPEAAAAESDILKLEHDSLQDEVTRLRVQNTTQAARIQQLERMLTILQTRLGVTQAQQ